MPDIDAINQSLMDMKPESTRGKGGILEQLKSGILAARRAGNTWNAIHRKVKSHECDISRELFYRIVRKWPEYTESTQQDTKQDAGSTQKVDTEVTNVDTNVQEVNILDAKQDTNVSHRVVKNVQIVNTLDTNHNTNITQGVDILVTKVDTCVQAENKKDTVGAQMADAKDTPSRQPQVTAAAPLSKSPLSKPPLVPVSHVGYLKKG